MIVRMKEKMDNESVVGRRISRLKSSSFASGLPVKIRLRRWDAILKKSGNKFELSLTFGGRTVLNSRGSLADLKIIMRNPKKVIESEARAATYDKTNPPSWIR